MRIHDWMVKSKNVEVDEKRLNAETCAFVVALSYDKGLVALDHFPKSLDQWKFISFLKKVRKAYGSKRIALYIDNASFHKALSVKKYAEENNIEIIYSPVYRPEFQPSEHLISYLKQYAKKKRLEGIVKGKENTFVKLLNEAKKRVDKQIC